MGFGKNHNNAFKLCKSKYFLVLNPDIIFPKNFNFSNLFLCLKSQFGVVSPKIITNNNIVHPRKFPIFTDYIFFRKQIDIVQSSKKVDWVSGCFMLFKSNLFKKINGFNENFFLYMEDIDICNRLNKINILAYVDYRNCVTHNAKNRSKKNLLHFFFHIRSLIRYFADN